MSCSDFYFKSSFFWHDHLYFILTEPNNLSQVVIANFTSQLQFEKPFCSFSVGEHPFIKRNTTIKVDFADCIELSKLVQFCNNGEIAFPGNFPVLADKGLIEKIISCLKVHEFTPDYVLDCLG